MSRSNKYPIFTDKKDKRSKRAANKRVRKWLKNIDSGFKGYEILKKIYDPYNIEDYKIEPINEEQYKKALRK
jgi:hypothetical protein